MRTATFQVTLQQPLIISQQAASAGSHHSLDYLPGSVFLGLVASRLYASLDTDSSWQAFHSGAIRFGDALPLQNGQQTHPTPFSLHHAKGQLFEVDGNYLAEALFDPALNKPRDGIQPVQLRQGYISAAGERLLPQMQQTLKTAIDRDKGFAAEGQLFGYEALSSGQKYIFSVQGDATISETLWDKITKKLIGSAQLGRSRTAQYGRVLIESASNRSLTPENTIADELCLWLISDLALSENGQATLTPTANLLGLPEGSELQVEKSYLRSRSYSVFNAYRRSFDTERQVISRGSVLRYKLGRALSAEELLRLSQGLGQFTESGLGVALVNPVMLSKSQPIFAKKQNLAASTTPVKIQRPESRLIQLLTQRTEQTASLQVSDNTARELFKDLCDVIIQARRYSGLRSGQALLDAPSKSQWGRLKQLANEHRHNPKALWNSLSTADDCVFRERSETPWGLRYGPNPDDILFIWMINKLKPNSGQATLPLLIGQLAAFGQQKAWQDCCDGKEIKTLEKTL